MAKMEQLLIIEPQGELKFRGPFTEPVTSYMKIINPTNHKICFKIKTTAPKKYCVRPNSGILGPEETADVAVSLQPFTYDPNEKSKHKFMVQSIIAPDEDVILEQLWRDAPNDRLMNSKLKCFFEMPNEASAITSAPPVTQLQSATTVELKSGKSAVSESVNAAIPTDEIQKAAKEVKTLREEISGLRHENINLKEQVLKMRTQQASQPQTPSRVGHENMQVTRDGNHITPFVYLACGIVIGLMAIFIGKYIF